MYFFKTFVLNIRIYYNIATMVEKIINEIKSYSNEKFAIHHSHFFKTAKGEYGEGDLFLGLRVPTVRFISKKYFKKISLTQVNILIKNPYHEIRLAAIIMLVLKYEKAQTKEKEEIFNLYLANINHINNWDLVDLSAQYIIGPFIFDSSEKLWELAKTSHLWSQRIAVLSTLYFIRHGSYQATLDLSKYFLTHKHDLIHKATGWMLREIGKRDINTLYTFLDEHHKVMPRTMLRYSIEKLSEDKRKAYMIR